MKKNNKDYLYKTIFKLFLSKHYELVTIRDIEKATGMTRGAVFYYTQNKLSLFCDIVDTYFFKAHDLQDKMQDLQKDAAMNGTLLDFIHNYVKKFDMKMEKLQTILDMEKAEASRAYLSFILQAQNYYPDFNKKINSIFDKELQEWKTVMDSAKEKGEIKQNIDTQYFATIFRNFYVGQCYHASLENGVNVAELEAYFMNMYMLIKN